MDFVVSGTGVIMTIILVLAYFAVFYTIYDVNKQKQFSGTQRFMWVFFLLFFSLISLFIYWTAGRPRNTSTYNRY